MKGQGNTPREISFDEFPYLAERVVLGQPLSGGVHVMRWYENLRFLYILEGMAELLLLDGKVSLAAGQGIFINQSVVHLVESTELCQYDSFSFPTYFLGFYERSPMQELAERLAGNRQLPIYVFDGEQDWHWRVLSALRRLGTMNMKENTSDLYPYEVSVLLVNMWLEMQRNIELPPKKRESAVYGRMQRFLYFIGQHFREDVTLEELAASAGVSKSECLRCFKQSLDTTPYKYLMDYRLAMATDLLRGTDRQISEIAVLTGFEQSSYFGKCFRERLGCTPKEYRKHFGEKTLKTYKKTVSKRTNI
ncbi:MAG: AraC family transcriptional regulator [Butyrivibrio sp.]|nr:AraC family transcriptional regulator [Muribaculum sp.]MCM1552349.1 AraC family transcriptional regulator [Butyrivibrio sp.]